MANRAIASASNRKRTSTSLIALAVLVAACGKDDREPTARPARERPLVYTTFFPTTYWTKRIGGDLVDVVCPLPADEDPIFWQPSPDVVRAYQGADLIVQNGAGLEKWVEAVSLPQWRTVVTARAFEGEWLHYQTAFRHNHGDQGAHDHEGLDGHTWLDPVLAKLQANEILKALVRLLPRESAALTSRYDALAKDLDALDAEFRALGKGPEGFFYVSHPAYNYVIKRYRWPAWRVRNLPDLDPQALPDENELRTLLRAIERRVDPCRGILWESEPAPAVSAAFAEAGLKSVVFDPLESANPGTDYIAKMRENIARLKPAFE
ncbi:MAG: metal ABC transporter substrate-binding protein [Planctomycetota bacterium]